MIMALRRSNPGQFLMRQSHFNYTNLMQWPIFAFQAPFSCILPVGSSKIVFEWSSPSTLWAAKKHFRGNCWHQTCVLRLLHDHTYAQKQTGSVLDTSMQWYDSKRELMAIFWFSYPLKGVYKGKCIEIRQKVCFSDPPLWLCGPRKFFLRITST